MSRRELYPHQRASVEWIEEHERSVLADETGTGKTPTLLTVAANAAMDGQRVTWVTERNLIPQLIQEAGNWLPIGIVPLEWADDRSRLTIVTPQTLAKRSDHIGEVRSEFVIVDEAQCVGAGGVNPKAAQFTAVRDLVAMSDRSVLATATPVDTGHALDLQALMEVGRIPGTPSRGDTNSRVIWTEFPVGNGQYRKAATGISDHGIDVLASRLGQSAIRTTVLETGQRLPGLRRETIYVPLSGRSAQEYAKAARQRGQYGHVKREQAARSIHDLVPAVVECLTTGVASGAKHPVIFTENHDLLLPIVAALRHIGWPVVTFTGREAPKARARVLDKFNALPRVALVGTSALEVGLNLQRSDTLISVVDSWNPSREAQREGRLVRVGSPHSEVLHVVIRADVAKEDRKDEIHARKVRVAQTVLGAIPSPLRMIGAAA